MARDDLAKPLRRRGLGRKEHATGAVQQRAPELERGGVERQRRQMQQRLARVQMDVVLTEQQAQHGALRHGDTFGLAGRARRVHHVRERIGRRDAGEVVGTLASQGVPIGVGHGQQHRHRPIIQNDAHAIEGQFEDAQQPHHHLHRALDTDSHQHLGADAESSQPMGQLIRAAVQLAVRDAFVVGLERDGGRRTLHLCLEQGGEARFVGIVGARVVPVHEELALLGRRQHRELGDARLGTGDDALKQRPEVLEHPRDRRRVEERGLVLHRSMQARVFQGERHGQIELRRSAGDLHVPDRQPRQLERRRRRILEREHHLNERCALTGALGLQRLHELLEGQVLMAVGGEGGLAHAPQQLPDGRIARQIGAQDQRVHEEADQSLDLDTVASGHGRADHNVLLAGVAVQQRLKCRQQRHEERDALLPAQGLEGPCERGRQQERVCGRARARCRRPPPVDGEREPGRTTGELPHPVGKLRLEDLIREPAPLPAREVLVLRLELRQR